MGFGNVAEYANADDAGQVWFTQFRKAVTSTATITSSYVDYTYFAGSPLANFYASSPLESAYVDPSRGIYLPDVSPARQYLKTINCMSAASAQNSTANRQQQVTLCDYLMYYPFFDTDSIDIQETTVGLDDNNDPITLPRYTSGKVLAIAQSASSTIGQFTMTYTNQDGTPGRVSPTVFTQIVGGGGQSLMADISGGGFNPFVPLQAGDIGVKSIESVTFTATGGGLMALVIVKPLLTFFVSEECRRETTTPNSFGSSTEYNSVLMGTAPEIKDGAILGLITKCQGGSLASSTLVGYIETIWN